MTLATPRNRKLDLPLLGGVGVSAAALILYALTLSPTVNFVDSGEFLTVGATAGIAHPPGYPLYTLLTILAAALPFGAIAVQVNAVSALAAALATGLFYALVYETVRYHLRVPRAAPGNDTRRAVPTRGRARQAPAARTPVGQGKGQRAAQGTPKAGPVLSSVAPDTTRDRGYPLAATAAAAGAAGLLAASFTFWDWATQAKVYTLHYVFVAGLFWLALRVRRAWRRSPVPGAIWPPAAWPAPARGLLALAALFGLALTNHTMTWLLGPGLAVLLLWPARPGAGVPWRWGLRYLPWLLLALGLPLLMYLYLPLRSAQQPVLDWGSPDSWGDFWRHVTLWEFSGFIKPTGTPLDYAGKATGLALLQWGPWLGLPIFGLAGTGLVRLAQSNKALLVATVLTVLITLVQTYNFQLIELAAYNVPWYMMALLWAGVGLDWLIQAGGAWLDAGARPAPADAAGGDGGARRPQAARALVAVPPALAVLALLWNVGRTGHRDDYLADAYLHNALKNFAPNALVVTNNWYLVSPSYYSQYVQHERPDLVIIDRKLIQYPFYSQYVDRQFPAVMSLVKDLEVPFATQERQWVNGEPIDAQRISQLYFDLMKALVSRNLAAGRPVYFDWIDPGQEEAFIAQGFNTHPEGLALRVDAQPFTGAPPDPQFDWRGILTNPVPKDDLAHEVIDEYPRALDRLASFAQSTNHPDEAGRFAAQAAQVRAALGLAK